jgi:hypothetical protein
MQRLQYHSYEEIGAVLRHSSVRTTQKYGKLESKKLRSVIEMKTVTELSVTEKSNA